MPDNEIGRWEELTDRLTEAPCVVIDPLPERVSAERGERYRTLAPFYHTEELFHKFADLLLRLNSYYDFVVWHRNTWQENPAPEDYRAWIEESRRTEEHLVFLFEPQQCMIMLDGDDAHMTLFGTDEALHRMVRQLALAEGLFVFAGQSQ